MSILLIAGDPAQWALGADSPANVIEQALLSQGGPIAVNVEAPLKGRLILSARSVTSVTVLTTPIGWIPGGAIESRATLYLPSPAGPTEARHGYTLDASADLAALESDIVTAMTRGTAIAVPVAHGAFRGTLLLNGRTLPFAVLGRPTSPPVP